MNKERKRIKKQVVFEKGELVLVKALRKSDWKKKICSKLLLLFDGPYEIENKEPKNSYILKDPQSDKIKGVYHISQLHKYYK